MVIFPPQAQWVVAQRQEYKQLLESQPSKLSAHRLQRLNTIGLDLTPAAKQQSWSERMESLRKFVEGKLILPICSVYNQKEIKNLTMRPPPILSENGHCKPPKDHPLSPFVINVRHFMRLREAGKHNSLTDERVVRLPASYFALQNACLTSYYTYWISRMTSRRSVLYSRQERLLIVGPQ